MTDRFQEARRLLTAGFKLCELHPMSKRPVGDKWNQNLVTDPLQVHAGAGGYGMPLAVNGMCSIDFDNAPVAEAGLRACGFDPAWLRDVGVATSSTRPGSGGRVAFKVPAGADLRWLRFANNTDGTILELRATSPNLQDCLPGTTYYDQKGGGPWTQDYDGLFTMDTAPELPPEVAAWWGRMSHDIEFLHQQQIAIAGPNAQLDVSSGKTLAYASDYRMAFNEENDVEDILLRHGYTLGRNGRYAPASASGAPSVRLIPGRQDLWQSDHASDPLFGTFDAWTAHVVLDHGQDLAAAERAAAGRRSEMAVSGFEEVEMPVALRKEAVGAPMFSAPVAYDLFAGGVVAMDDLGLPLDDGALVRLDDLGLPVDAPPAAQPQADLPAFERDKKTGKILATIGNVLKALRSPDVCGARIGMDRFRDEIMLAPPGTDQWRPFGDPDYVWMRERLEKGACAFNPIAKELVRDAVLAVSCEHEFDSAILWLNSLEDDGGSRVETFLIDYFGVDDTPYTRAVSRYMWTAMAGRVLEPGCKADMAPILVGKQGLGKSSAVAALVPSASFFTEVSFSEKDDDLARKMRGKLVAEIGELRGLHTKELEAIKAFISRTHEEWIPKYREFGTTFPRRLIFVGSTNKDQFLADETGNRRWLPVRVHKTVDVAELRRIAPLLWAEAARLFRQGGVEWRAAQELAVDEHEEYKFTDSWQESVETWLADPLFGEENVRRESVTVRDALIEAIGYDAKAIGRRDEMRMGALLRDLGYERRKKRTNGKTGWAFFKNEANVPTLE